VLSVSVADNLEITGAAIVAEALSWVGTPYRHQASLKGVGCDCLGLIRGVWRAFYGPEPEAMPAYTPDWAEARGAETLAAAARRHLSEIAPADAGAGDVLLFRWRANLPAKHAAILISVSRSDLRSSSPLVGADRFVHAQQGAAVATAALTPWWRRRIAYAFRFPNPTDAAHLSHGERSDRAASAGRSG
jgi:NlpC/P60 family putative phage cell wall peptidase